MNVQRIARFTVVGVGLAGLTACNMMGYDAIGGQFGDPLNNSRSWGKNTGTSGWVTQLEPFFNALCVNTGCQQNCWPVPIGKAHLKGGVGTTGEPQGGAVLSMRGYGRFLASCPLRFGKASDYPGLGRALVASVPSDTSFGGLALATETTDTNGDGVISAGGTNGGAPFFNHSPTCANPNLGISQVQYFAAPPFVTLAANIARDDMTCFKPALPAGVTKAANATEHVSMATTLGGAGNSLVMQQAPGADHNVFSTLPIAVQADLLGSVDTETDVVRTEDGNETVKFRVTGVRLYGATYTPRGVTATMNSGNFLGEVMSGPGGRLMAAWAADQLQRFLDAGGTTSDQLRASATINDSAVISLADMKSGSMGRLFRDPDQNMVNDLRRMATSR